MAVSSAVATPPGLIAAMTVLGAIGLAYVASKYTQDFVDKIFELNGHSDDPGAITFGGSYDGTTDNDANIADHEPADYDANSGGFPFSGNPDVDAFGDLSDDRSGRHHVRRSLRP